MNVLLRPLFHMLSPARGRAKLQILIFHRVLTQPDPLQPGEVDAAHFDQVCGWLRAWFNVLPLDEAVARLKTRSLPERALSITFDDGYADNHDVALPILQRHGLSATFFIATAFLDGGRMWNDTVIEAVRGCVAPCLNLRGVEGLALGSMPMNDDADRRAAIVHLLKCTKYLPVDQRLSVVNAIAEKASVQLPNDLMMTASQVQALRRAGMQVGAHTASHPILARLDESGARAEILGGKSALESLLGEPIRLFAYPNGKPGQDYGPVARGIVINAGFNAAVSTAPGVAAAASDPWQLPRFTPWERNRSAFALRLMNNLRTARDAGSWPEGVSA